MLGMATALNSGSSAHGSQVSVLPLSSRIVAFGDSITAARGFAGYMDWGLFSSRGRYYPKTVGSNGTGPTGWNQGVVGNTTTQMIARLSNVTAENPKVCVVLGGINDITTTALTAAQIFANLTTIYNALEAAGIKVVPITILPCTSSFTGPMETIRTTVNASILARYPNAVQSDNYINTATDLLDGKHPNGSGAQKLGNATASAIAAKISASEILYDPAAVPAENLYTNSTFAGGTTTATSWTFFQASNGLTKAASKTTLDGYNVQKYVATGTASANAADNFNQNVAVTGGLTGDLVEAWVEVNVVKATGMTGIAISAGTNTTNTTHMSITAQDSAALVVPFRGVLRAPPTTLAADAPTLSSRLSILPANAAVCDIEVQFLRAGYRKVPAGQ